MKELAVLPNAGTKSILAEIVERNSKDNLVSLRVRTYVIRVCSIRLSVENVSVLCRRSQLSQLNFSLHWRGDGRSSSAETLQSGHIGCTERCWIKEGAGLTNLLTIHCAHWVHISTGWIARLRSGSH